MAHHKRKRAKHRCSGCLLCKPQKLTANAKAARHRSRQESFDYERAADEEAEAVAAERIRSGAADHHEDGADALERLGIAVPLTGALSKNGTADQLARLNALRKKLLREAAKAPSQPTPPPRRIGEISEAVRKVLADATKPLHVAEIHKAVEHLLGRSVSYRSVKACLSEGTTRRQPQFNRVSYGCYRLRRS